MGSPGILDNNSDCEAELFSGRAELSSLLGWLRTFEAEEGRPLRVLHIGNIAGNAFLNAKFLRSVGVEADMVSHDYDHVMSFPEWEEVELRHSHGDDNNPKFDKRDTKGYQRPDWYISGPLTECVEQIGRRYGVPGSRIRRIQIVIANTARRIAKPLTGIFIANVLQLAISRPWAFLTKAYMAIRRRGAGSRLIPPFLKTGIKSLEGTGLAAARIVEQSLPLGSGDKTPPEIAKMQDLCERFQTHFPDRPDVLTNSDLSPYIAFLDDYERMFAPYDIVQCYATLPIYALVAGKRPYVAFEHGTLRHFTTEDHPLHRLTALAYREADHTFITNGDCLGYAQRLGIKAYSPVIHPVNVAQHRQDFSEDALRIRKELGADVLIYCPVRHDYEIKGTDRVIDALPLIKQRTDKRVVMILSKWGAQVGESRKRIKAHGCKENVVWRGSMSRIAMIKYMQAADVVYDQFVLPVFGSTAPQAIAAGRPVLASYVPKETAWLIPEPAPIVSAFTPEEIAERTIQCLNPEWLEDYQNRAKLWIDRYHSPGNVLLDHLRVYRDVLESLNE